MQPYDIFMLIVLVGAAAFGAWKGMAWQLASIGSVVVSAFVALRFSGLLAPSLSAEEPWNQFLAMGILFAGTSLAVWIAFRFVSSFIDRVKLKEFDHQMGALFGAAKGVLYCLVLTFFAVTLSESTRQRVLNSRSGTYAAVLVQKGTPMMPEKVRSALDKYIEQLDEGLNPETPPASPIEDPQRLGETVPGTGIVESDLPFGPENQPPAVAEQPAQPRLRPWEPNEWKQGAQEMLDEHADRFQRDLGTAVENRVDEIGRDVGAALDRNYNQFRDSVNRSSEEIQSDVNEQFDALGRRIRQRPMKPIQ